MIWFINQMTYHFNYLEITNYGTNERNNTFI